MAAATPAAADAAAAGGVVGSIDGDVARAARWIAEADAVLVCAGAGMSVTPESGENVYVSAEDFAAHYGAATVRGLNGRRTAYECMDLLADPAVPRALKWGFWARHMDKQSRSFAPGRGYALLRQLLGVSAPDKPTEKAPEEEEEEEKLVVASAASGGDAATTAAAAAAAASTATTGGAKDYFVLTSNVDACFERAGFDPSRIYTPQGEWTYYQCMGKNWRGGPCRPDAVWPSAPVLDRLLPLVDPETGTVPGAEVPVCPYCKGETFGNVRGGGWYLHRPYDAQHDAFVQWVQDHLNKRIVVIEIGAGFNTPTVTRWPMEALVAQLAGDPLAGAGDGTTTPAADSPARKSALVRINPTADQAEVPGDLPRAVGIPRGWDALQDIIAASGGSPGSSSSSSDEDGDGGDGQQQHEMWYMAGAASRGGLGHWDWQRFIRQLKR